MISQIFINLEYHQFGEYKSGWPYTCNTTKEQVASQVKCILKQYTAYDNILFFYFYLNMIKFSELYRINPISLSVL